VVERTKTFLRLKKRMKGRQLFSVDKHALGGSLEDKKPQNGKKKNRKRQVDHQVGECLPVPLLLVLTGTNSPKAYFERHLRQKKTYNFGNTKVSKENVITRKTFGGTLQEKGRKKAAG